MNPITIPNSSIPTIGIPTIGIPSVGFPSASGGGGLVWPVGMKEHIKAIYDPKKQGMTSFDVIESYAEDFTTWRYLDSRGTAAVTPNKITITESFDTTNIVEDVEEPYSDISIYVTGVSEDVPLVVRDITGNKAIITKDGKYDFSKNSRFMGFAIYKILSNINVVISLLPTSILKDLSGNGNHAYLYGGKGKLNSGMGVYKFDFLSDLLINSAYLPYTERQYDSICSLAGHPNGWLFQYKSLTDIPTFKIEVKGIVNDKFHYRWYDENGNRGVDFVIDKDGIYEFPMSYSVETNTGVGIVCNNICQDNVCFTQIPDYPNQLCYDGKMYAVCYGFPILTDYTVMADRTWFENKGSYAFISKRTIGNIMGNAFVFEKDDNTGTPNSLRVYSFGAESIIMPNKNNSISYQTKTKYNNQNIRYGNNKDSSMLMIGAGLYRSDQNLITELWSGCHGTIIVADRSFTEEEINWLKDNWKKI